MSNAAAFTAKKNDVDAQNESADYASKKMKDYANIGKDIYRANLAANGLSHGFYMGKKWAEEKHKKLFFPLKFPVDSELLERESSAGAEYYSNKKLKNHNREDRILISTFISVGFSDGVRKYESEILQ